MSNAAKRIREITKAVEAVWSDYSIEYGGKHPRVVLRRGPHKRTLLFPASPGDRRGAKNWAAELKHKVAELKALPIEPERKEHE